MEEQVNAALAALLERVVQAGDFAVASAPEVIQQLLAYKFIVNAVWAVFGLVLVLVCVYGGRVWHVKHRASNFEHKYSYDEFDHIFPLIAGGLLTAILPGAVFVASVVTMVKIKVAPAVYLIEYAAKLVSGS